MIFTYTYEPRFNDFNEYGKMNYEMLLELFEDIGFRHTRYAADKVAKDGISWIMVDWNMHIITRPVPRQRMHLSTWARVDAERPNAPTSTTYRDFLATDEEGNAMFYASAKFALVDMEVGKLIRITPERLAAYEPETKSVFEKDGGRLKENNAFEKEETIALRRTDIDFNKHVHNTRYLEFAVEALPRDVYERDSITDIRIVYRKPVKFEDAPIIRHSKNNNTHQFAIYVGEQLCTMIEMKEESLC